jgi:hypothetical protein
MKNSGKQRKTAGGSLLFLAPRHAKLQGSAKNEGSSAVNVMEEQRKQREIAI